MPSRVAVAPPVLCLLAAFAVPGWSAPDPTPTRAPFRAFALYVLSRGKGVPQAAEDALARVQEIVEADRGRGVALKLETRTFGLEGETRLCVEYGSAEDARRAFDKAQSLVKGVELTNLVVEDCASRGSRRDGRKEEAKP